MEDWEIPANEIISVRLLLLATPNTTFKAYSTFTDNSIIKRVEMFKDTNKNIFSELEKFFQDLKSRIDLAINKLHAT